MATREGWKLCENFVGNDKTCMRVKISPDAYENITQVSVYNLELVITALQAIKRKLPPTRRKVQISFAKEQIGIVMFLKGWCPAGDSFFPEIEDEYIGIAPISAPVDVDDEDVFGYHVWELARTLMEVETIPVGNASEICPNHAGVAIEEEIMERLET
jgi:hypothetical protein